MQDWPSLHDQLSDDTRACGVLRQAVAIGRAMDHPVLYETAWQAWRDLARDVQAAVTEHAKQHGAMRARSGT